MPMSNIKIIEKLFSQNEELGKELKELKMKINILEGNAIQLKEKDNLLEKEIALVEKKVKKYMLCMSVKMSKITLQNNIFRLVQQ